MEIPRDEKRRVREGKRVKRVKHLRGIDIQSYRSEQVLNVAQKPNKVAESIFIFFQLI